ncbi:Putative ABC transporter permease [Croceitalea dokdonensis DOKDO 023]|uniref:Putative ABC transporter permease n=1 Tax=Croceitalea dokdonensis DOKDO 023 TaxID=1300341 RepID=A0A0P7AFC1_9FLAO|nr:ABC transporter permease [Croceitalea dokdonensis]KPM30835.1 Putative ABC transporter permease [Croceitalea dokdonensis DOKDO 023]
MFKNHIKIAWRSLKRQPFFTFLNIFGLAIGMAGVILITLYIRNELSHDKMFADADRIHRINADVKFGGDAAKSAETAAPMAAVLENDFSQVEMATRIRNLGGVLIRKSDAKENTKELHTAFADDNIFKMFGLDLLVGDTETALKEPNTLILTKTAALKHFGVNNAVGQKVLLDNNDTYTVTGVIDDLPKNSLLRNHSVFMAMSGYEDAQQNEWGSHNYFTFIKLIPSVQIEDFQAPLQSIVGDYLIPWVQQIYPGITEEGFTATGNYVKYYSIPLTDIHLYSEARVELSSNGSIQNIYILFFIGLFLILLASVNFMNLSTAYSLKRAKEVGIRKTLGSNKSGLVRQFLTESGLISFLSLLVAFTIALIAMPFFNDLAGTAIQIPFTNFVFWIVLLLATLALSLFAGWYPAFFMSRFIPVKVLKGLGKSSVGGGNIRNSLVVFQFAISVFLIVGTLVVFKQLDYIQSKELGFSKEQILLIEDFYGAGEKSQSIKRQMESLAQVESATISSFLPTPSSRSDYTFFKEGFSDQEDAVNMQRWLVDHDYLKTLDIKLKAGRGFKKERVNDSTAIIINETAATLFGMSPEEALGVRVSSDLGDEDGTFYTVIGVVENFHFKTLRENIGALSFRLGNSTGNMALKINTANISSTITSIENIWQKSVPEQPLVYSFMEDSFNTTYQAEQRLGRIFMVFTILSIFIACLGLFGLAAFNAEKRTKEIGVRKVLGASVGQISYRLTLDFLKLVGIAIFISLPLGWYAMNKWLEDFSYRIEIGWWVLVLAGAFAIAIAIITVSYQSIKAAIVNPVKSLRSE